MQTVLITGVSKGIGRALAEKFLAEGHTVIGTVFSGTLEAAHGLTLLPLDLASPQSIAACAQSVAAMGVHIDILINNAGALFDEDYTALHVEKLRKTLEVNLIGTADFTERIVPLMADGGHIVNLSSTAGSLEKTVLDAESHYPLHYPAYKISKAALNMYTRTLALRMRERNITVSSAHPGWVRTDMGGPDAGESPAEAAEGLYGLAISRPETGNFWYRDIRLPW